jgi:outer membrane receptor protein involved in Fe transport
MFRTNPLTLLLLALIVGIFILPQAAFSQGNDEEEVELEEVIVTARFREESLQDVGASIAAYSGDMIDREGLVEVQDLALRTVGMEVLDLGPNINDINIRGISNALPTGRGLKALATTFVDDVSVSGLGSGAATDFNMFDFSRVEILRGPQPTYFGEGSVGGTIRYFSADPNLDGRFEGTARAGISTTRHGDSSWRGEAALTIPMITDQLALRVVGFYQDSGGFIDLPNLDAKDGNSFDSIGGRAVLLWEPNENFTARFSAHINRLEFGETYEIDPTQDLSSLSGDNLYSAATSFAANNDDYDLYTAKLAYNFGNITVESVTGYFERGLDSSAESSANTIGFKLFLEGVFGVTGIDTTVLGISDTQEKSFSQEFRFISDFDGRINFTGGVYYKDSKLDSQVALVSEGLGATIIAPPNPLILDNIDKNDTEQASAFIEFTADITDRFRLIGGVRYVDETLTTTLVKGDLISFSGFLGIDPDTGYPQFPIASDLDLLASLGLGTSFDFNLKEWLPRFGAEFDLSEDMMLYANAARGLRNGGLNQIVSAAFEAFDPNTGMFDDAIFRDALEFAPDVVDTIELGLKSRLNGGRTTFNAAIFYSDYQDPQVLVGVPTASIKNAPDEDIWGVELETAFLINDNWTAYANGSYLFAEFTDNKKLTQVPGVPVEFEDLKKGNRPTNTPKWTFSVGADFDYPIGDGTMSLVGHGSFSYVDERWGSVQNYPLTLLGSMEIVNLRLGLRGERWLITAYVNNLLNDLEKQATLAPSNAAFIDENGVLDANLSQVFVNRPMTLGLQFSLNF